MMRSTPQNCDPETYLHKNMLLRPSLAIAPPLADQFAPLPPKKRKVDDLLDDCRHTAAEVPLTAEAATNHQLISSQSKKRRFGDQIMPIGRSKVDDVEVPLAPAAPDHQLISSQSKKRGFGNQIIPVGRNKVDNFQVSHATTRANHQLISSQSKKRRFGEIMPVGWSKVDNVEVSFAPASPDHHHRRFLMAYKKRRFETPDSHRTVNDFKVEHRLGEGSFGVVYKARDRWTGEHVAMKKFQVLPGGEKENEEDQRREIEYMRLCRHPSVVQLKEVVRDQDGKSLVMVMELGGHDLSTVLDAWPGKMQESQVRFLMLQLLQGMKCLHGNKIIHRDLKTSNILLSTDGKLRICDFGLACKCNSGRQQNTQKVGTIWYNAPEMLLEAKDYTAAVDMWSVGCIMAELLMKEPLFPGATEEDQLSKIVKVLGAPTEKTLPGLEALPGASMLKQTMKRSRNQLYLKFTKEPKLSKPGLDLLKGLLLYDPLKRLSVDAALGHPWFTINSYDVPIYDETLMIASC